MPKRSYFSLRATILTLSMAIPTLLLGVFCIAQEKTPKPMTSKQKFKNIKVLKDLPADQMIPLMQKINASLGVKCDFCHVIKQDHSGFELDEKPAKNVARDMIKMTQTMNKKFKSVKNKVNCFTCHRGHQEPE